MSVNNIIYRDYIPELEAFKEIIESYFEQWRGAETLEEQLTVESKLVNIFNQVIKLSGEIEEFTTLDSPEVMGWNNERILRGHALRISSSKLKSLASTYLSYFNSGQQTILELLGAIKRNKQKLSTLKLWDRSKSKWVISEHFLNFDKLSTEYISEVPAHIETSAGYMTLPIQESKDITVSSIRIGAGSNGFSGNSEILEISTNNRLPSFIFDGDPQTWFECERLDEGPLELELSLELGAPEIINAIRLEAINLGNAVNYKVGDITFNTSSGKSQSIRELISPAIPDDFFTVQTLGNDIYWEIAFMPTECRSVLIKLRQENSYPILTRALDGREVTRERFAIGIRSLQIKQNRYLVSGGYNSTAYNIPAGMYGAVATADVFPRNTNLFSASMNVSFDGAMGWERDVLGLPEVEGQTLLLDGNPLDAFWSLVLKRSDDAFKGATSFSDEEPKAELNSLLRTVSIRNSPTTISLPEKPWNKEVMVIQPRLARKTFKQEEAVSLGFLGRAAWRLIDLPIPLDELNLSIDDITVFLNGIECWKYDYSTVSGVAESLTENDEEVLEAVKRETNNSVLATRKGITGGAILLNNQRQLLIMAPSYTITGISESFQNVLDSGPGDIRFMIREELPLFTERSDGYYCKLSSMFDPDKENISVKRLPSALARTSIQLPPGKLRYSLGVKYIATCILKSEATFTLVDGINSLALSGDYYIDKVNGMAYFYQEFEGNVNLVLSHAKPELLGGGDYEIWVDKITPVGLIVKPSAMAATLIKDKLVGDKTIPLPQVFDVETGKYESRPRLFPSSTTKHTLSHKNIIRNTIVLSSEVFGLIDNPPPVEESFIDGETEFLGLIPMEREYTAETEGDINGFVRFNLAAGTAYYSNLGIVSDESEANASYTYFSMEKAPYSNGEELLDAFMANPSFDAEWRSGEGTVGEKATWAVDKKGLVTVYVGTGGTLPGMISLRYFYKNITFDSKRKYSVDYKNGILYLSQPLDTTKDRDIQYKVANYSIAFNIANKIDKFEYSAGSNAVKIRTENLVEQAGNQVKVLWGKPPEDVDLTRLEAFFSPIVYSVGLRFQ